MKSSTLHRSNLTKERMSMLENVKFQGKAPSLVNSANQYIRVNKTMELDVLYRSLGRNTLKKTVSQGSSPANSKTKINPKGIYLSLSVIGGAIFLVIVSLVVWISSFPAKKSSTPVPLKTNTKLEVVQEVKETNDDVVRKERYTIKHGDTLDKVAHRFYGKYDVSKIEEIKRINNIVNPESLQIGQVLIIPLDK